MLTPEVSMEWVVQALKSEHDMDGKLTHAWACDNGAAPQIIMRAMVEQQEIEHCYSDLEHFLTARARRVL